MREQMELSGVPVFAAFHSSGTSRGEPVLRSLILDFFSSFQESFPDLEVADVMKEIDEHCDNETLEAQRTSRRTQPFQWQLAEPHTRDQFQTMRMMTTQTTTKSQTRSFTWSCTSGSVTMGSVCRRSCSSSRHRLMFLVDLKLLPAPISCEQNNTRATKFIVRQFRAGLSHAR